VEQENQEELPRSDAVQELIFRLFDEYCSDITDERLTCDSVRAQAFCEVVRRQAGSPDLTDAAILQTLVSGRMSRRRRPP
jgi:hypothetical protein